MARREARKTNLPVERGAFVGRTRALQELAALLQSGARTITLTGPEGVGKTRLALRAAALELPAFVHHGGIFVVDLSDVRELHDLAARGLEALGLEASHDPTAMEAVLRVSRFFASAGPALLLLDGCDEGRELVRSVVERWGVEAPELRVLATARAPLGLAGEQVVPVKHGRNCLCLNGSRGLIAMLKHSFDNGRSQI